eukprot:TRINITY_DN14655_c0_g1_i3.p1 TRINITY_DN14655_c0_g1~~TRINITY_DN14655_c0_g1_i3.p1  ORF type:complete len:194 (-),score=30.82 TRINITY_DN14655_c0_g1_i3:115-696(-)
MCIRDRYGGAVPRRTLVQGLVLVTAGDLLATFCKMEGLPEGNKRTLTRDTSTLREFDDSDSPDLLVLYHHCKDSSFDCFNAPEYHEQMLRYYEGNFKVVTIVPRTIRDNDYFLVCLQHNQAEGNIICELAFLCFRQFCGVSMLVKKRCFVCNAPTKLKCKGCQSACFCSKECQAKGWKPVSYTHLTLPTKRIV